MASVTEIRTRIKSVEQTLKITNAMYLISSSKLKKARGQLADVVPYFQKVNSTIADILRHSPDISHPFFEPRANSPKKTGYIVITGDKGLAGAYNHNVCKLAESFLADAGAPTLFVIGQVGRHYFLNKKIPIDAEFMYTAQDPTVFRAREISETMVDLYLRGQLDEVNVIFTEMVTPLHLEPKMLKILPLDKKAVTDAVEKQERYREILTYVPTVEAVIDNLVPGYVKGIMFGAMVESFCSEQNARMTAMDSATQSARKLIKGLNLQYNRARQAAITQELTEIVGGAEGLRQ